MAGARGGGRSGGEQPEEGRGHAGRPTRAAPARPGDAGGGDPARGPAGEPRSAAAGLLARLLPLVMLLARSASSSSSASTTRRRGCSAGMIALSTLGMVAGGSTRGGAQRRAESDEERADYLRYLAQMRRRARTAAEQRRQPGVDPPRPGRARRPSPADPRIWERRPGDADFAHVRVGRGAQRLATALVPPQTGPVEDLEPVTTVALRRFVRTHSVVAGPAAPRCRCAPSRRWA